jgi:hypothetical protein
MKQKQEDWVKEKLFEKGYITRNECLAEYITRLGAIINRLKKKGYGFEAKYVKTPYGKDFVYKIFKKPGSKLFE